MLNSNDEKILQEIIDLDGKCLDSKRCQGCPFRAVCLPEFLYPVPPTQQQRLRIALDVLANQSILGDSTESSAVQSSHGWGSNARQKT